MDAKEWSSCTDLQRMLQFLTTGVRGVTYDNPTIENGTPIFTVRQKRLFVCACCRALWSQILDHRSRKAIEIAELYADGEVSEDEFMKARNQAFIVWNGLSPVVSYEAERAFIAWAACSQDMSDFRPNSDLWGVFELLGLNREVQALLLHDICGNPWSDVMMEAQCFPQYPLKWRSSTVLSVAKSIYNERRFSDMPILGDALEDAGCDNREILDHCRLEPRVIPRVYICERCGKEHITSRTQGIFCYSCRSAYLRKKRVSKHVLGCWVLDQVLD